MVRKNSKLISTFIFTMIVMCHAGVFAGLDRTPPVVDKTEPANGHLSIPQELTLQVWIMDPESDRGLKASGVDPETVKLYIDSQLTPVSVQNIGSNRVRAFTKSPVNFPGSTWIECEVLAKDYAGNTMTPYYFHFLTESDPDTTPPEISHLYPEDQSTGVICHPVIACRIQDDFSGVDLNSVTFKVNNKNIIFTYALEEDYVEIFHVPVVPFGYSEVVQCRVSVMDLDGNLAVKYWDFQTCIEPVSPPKQVYPTSNALLNFQLENGYIRFIWMSERTNEFIRIRIRPESGYVFEIIDLGREEFWTSGNLRGFSYYVGQELWQHLSDYSHVEWSIAIIDQIGGECVSDYSKWEACRLAPPDAVVLRYPENDADFFAFDGSPVFKWDGFAGAKSYLLGIAKYNPFQQTYENKLTLYVESELTSVQLDEQVWRQLGPGEFIWAILAETEKGTYSDFMNYQFSKLAPVIIEDPIFFN